MFLFHQKLKQSEKPGKKTVPKHQFISTPAFHKGETSTSESITCIRHLNVSYHDTQLQTHVKLKLKLLWLGLKLVTSFQHSQLWIEWVRRVWRLPADTRVSIISSGFMRPLSPAGGRHTAYPYWLSYSTGGGFTRACSRLSPGGPFGLPSAGPFTSTAANGL